MSETLTAYQVESSTVETEELEIETEKMVEIKSEAYQDAGLGDLEMSEETDGEHEYERLGFVIDKHTDDFNWANAEGDGGQTVTVEDGEEVYIVGLSHSNAGAHPFYADELEPVDRNEVLGDVDVDPSEMGDGSDEDESDDESEENSESIAEKTGNSLEFTDQGYTDDSEELEINGVTTVDELSPIDSPVTARGNVGAPWPKSWKKADKPARLIAMDAWIDMGASFRGCRRSMVKSMSNPNRFCASYKDAIYGHTYWRSGG